MAAMSDGEPITSDSSDVLAQIEQLRQYWTTGAGGARIRWGTDGDLTRCHRLVSAATRDDPSFTSDDVWGFCQNLHIRLFGRANPRD